MVFGNPEDSELLENLEIVKEGFNIFAFLFAGLWALYYRAWNLFPIVVLAQIFFVGGVKYGIFSADLLNFLSITFNLWVGFEASSFRERALKSRGFILMDIIWAQDEGDAKIKFIERYEGQIKSDFVTKPDPADSSGSEALVLG